MGRRVSDIISHFPGETAPVMKILCQ